MDLEKEDVLELVKRLGNIHFTMIIISGIIMSAFYVSNKSQIELAYKQYNELENIFPRWHKNWMLDYAEEIVSENHLNEKLMPNWVLIQNDSSVFSLESLTNKSYIIQDVYKHSLEVADINPSEFSLKDFKDFWNSLIEINSITMLLPEPTISIFKVDGFSGDWLDDCRAGYIVNEEKFYIEYDGLSKWSPFYGDKDYYYSDRNPLEHLESHFQFTLEDFELLEPDKDIEIKTLTGFDTCTIDLMTSIARNNEKSNWSKILRNPENYTIFFSMTNDDDDVYCIPFRKKIILFNPLLRLKGIARNETWEFSTFSEEFPELVKLTGQFDQLKITEVGQIIESQYVNDNGSEINAFGTAVPFKLIRLGGLILLIGIQMYYYIHLSKLYHLFNSYKLKVFVPWIGLYESLISKTTYIISVIVLPIFVSVGVILYIILNNYGITSIIANTVLLIIVLVLSVNTYSVYTSLRKVYFKIK